MLKNEHVLYTAQQLACHARDIGRTFNVHTRVDGSLAPDDAGAGHLRDAATGQKLSRRCVKHRPITDETSYAVAMHEYGHCLAPDGTLVFERRLFRMSVADARLQYHEEEAAWAWAEYYAIQWTPIMEVVKAQALATYKQKLTMFEREFKPRRKGINKR